MDRSDNVSVIGYPPPPRSGEVWWHLTINEDDKGSTDSYPRFKPISQVSKVSFDAGVTYAHQRFGLQPMKACSGTPTTHSVFKKHSNPDPNSDSFGLSFTTQTKLIGPGIWYQTFLQIKLV